MYNNLLWANWSAELLAKVAIIGNSFRSYTERPVVQVTKGMHTDML